MGGNKMSYANNIRTCFFLIFVFINKGVALKNQYEIKDDSLLGPNKIQTVRYSNKESFLIGTAAGGIETFVNHPLWVWKTRSQYGGYFTLNPKTIYKGVFARVINMSGITATRVTLRDIMLRGIVKEEEPTLTHNTFASFLGGAFSSPLSSSLELILTQQQINFKKKEFSSFLSSCSTMKKREGVKIFWTGLSCSMMRDGIINACLFCVTPHIKHYISTNTNKKNDIEASIFAGLFSGGLSAVLTNPFDTVKSIQQSEALIDKKDRRTAFKVSLDLWRQERAKGFYKGFFWRAARLIIGIPILFYSIEMLTEFYQ